MKRKLFIAFEGIEDSGKDTQMQQLIESFRELGDFNDIYITREPSMITKEGIQARMMLKEDEPDERVLLQCFIRDRRKHAQYISSLLDYAHVVTSRYDMSTYAYQMSQGFAFEYLEELHEGILLPDITFFLRLNSYDASQRKDVRKEPEYFEHEMRQSQVALCFDHVLKFLHTRGRYVITIDATQPIEDIAGEVKQHVLYYIEKNKLK